MAENSFKNVSTQPKPFFLLPVKTLFLLGVSFSSILGGVCLGVLGACFSIGIYLSVFQKI
ncbi:hypothetical protein HPHPP28B_0353 [Helicobacter pylori Hp P-28b]|uniref:hypothetical protein n=1 Tax=Helicobacter pylori TaxID=210 RepID=UPI00026B30AF|nr:hypothetical protein [Helicobacter pylori]EJC39279.1 hypothetical protein HPHPP28B_0353 [Helicobacter pylori Hp P-28b]